MQEIIKSYGPNHELEGVRLSQHFLLQELLIAGPIIVTSGFRCEAVNRKVGGVRNSQHLTGQVADIHLADPSRFRQLVEFLKTCKYTDQLLTGSTWLHVSWTPFGTPRHFIRIGYYK